MRHLWARCGKLYWIKTLLYCDFCPDLHQVFSRIIDKYQCTIKGDCARQSLRRNRQEKVSNLHSAFWTPKDYGAYACLRSCGGQSSSWPDRGCDDRVLFSIWWFFHVTIWEQDKFYASFQTCITPVQRSGTSRHSSAKHGFKHFSVGRDLLVLKIFMTQKPHQNCCRCEKAIRNRCFLPHGSKILPSLQ